MDVVNDDDENAILQQQHKARATKMGTKTKMGIEGKDRMKEEGGVLRWTLVSSGHVA